MQRDDRTGLYLPGTADYATTEDSVETTELKPQVQEKTKGGIEIPQELVDKAGRDLGNAKSYREALKVYKSSLAFDEDTREAARILLEQLNKTSAERSAAGTAKRKAKKAVRKRVRDARKKSR